MMMMMMMVVVVMMMKIIFNSQKHFFFDHLITIIHALFVGFRKKNLLHSHCISMRSYIILYINMVHSPPKVPI